MTQWCQLGHRESLDRRRQLDGHPIFVHFLKVRHLAKHNKTSSQTFNRFCKGHVLIDDDTSYNVLISKSLLNALGIIVSMPHLAMKFPNHKGKIVTIKVDQVEARECYAKSYSSSPTHLPLWSMPTQMSTMWKVLHQARPILTQGKMRKTGGIHQPSNYLYSNWARHCTNAPGWGKNSTNTFKKGLKTCWHIMPISSLGAYSDYNQIKMYPPDESKTTFITEDANFCYKVMPFSLDRKSVV